MEPFVWRQGRSAADPDLFLLDAWERRFEGLSVGFTSRSGGVSEAPYDSLNCGLHVQDDPERVVANRQRLATAIGIPFEATVFAEQVHGAEVAVVGDADRGAGRDDPQRSMRGVDALVTDRPGIALQLMYADCIPLYFYDPVHRVAALAHAGWKGTVERIAMATISRMTQTYGTKPEELYAAIGPGIGACCYEVDDRVAERVVQVLEEIDAAIAEQDSILQRQEESGRYRLDLKTFNRLLMTKAGILSSRIEVTTLCTGCRTDVFFSHRREGGRTGRMIAWMALKNEHRR